MTDLKTFDFNLPPLTTEVYFEHFTDYTDNHIRKMENGEILTPKKRIYSDSSIRQYRGMLESFKEFEENLPRRIKTNEINKKIFQEFELFLSKKGLALNSASQYISKLKSISNVLFDEEIIFRPIKYKIHTERTPKIYLSIEEISLMKNCPELSETERLVVDMFLLQTFSCLRYSTLVKFLKSPYGYIKEFKGSSYISITADKTGEDCVIPLSDIIVDILTKYNGNIKPPSESYINRNLKIIGKKSGLTNLFPHRITIGGEMQEKLIPKYMGISTTTSRRNFLTLIKDYVYQDSAITSMSGHKSTQQMESYVQSSKLDKIKPFLNNEFFKLSL